MKPLATLALLTLGASAIAQAQERPAGDAGRAAKKQPETLFPRNSLKLRLGASWSRYASAFWGDLAYVGGTGALEIGYARFTDEHAHDLDLRFQAGSLATQAGAYPEEASALAPDLRYRYMHALPCGRYLGCRLGGALDMGSVLLLSSRDNNTGALSFWGTIDLAGLVYHDLGLRSRRFLRFSLAPQLSLFGIAANNSYAVSYGDPEAQVVSYGRFVRTINRLEFQYFWRRGNALGLAYDFEALLSEIETHQVSLINNRFLLSLRVGL